MDILAPWAESVAAAADPAEVDLAPDIVTAYLEGGEARAELFKQDETSIAGGFGLGTAVALLPWILNGIAAAAKSILSLLASSELGNILGVVKDVLDIRKEINPQQAVEQLPPTAPYTALKRVIDAMSQELRTAGIETQEADLITFRVLNALLEDPQGTSTFVEHLE